MSGLRQIFCVSIRTLGCGYWDEAKTVSYVDALLGGPIKLDKTKALAASPMTYVSKTMRLFLSSTWENDSSVPVGHWEFLAAALRASGVESWR
jgi:hypothetical protein